MRIYKLLPLIALSLTLSSCSMFGTLDAIIQGGLDKAYRMSMPEQEVEKDKNLAQAMQNFQQEAANINIHGIPQAFKQCAQEVSQKYNIPLALIYAITKHESDFNPKSLCYNPCGCRPCKGPRAFTSIDCGITQDNTMWVICPYAKKGALRNLGLSYVGGNCNHLTMPQHFAYCNEVRPITSDDQSTVNRKICLSVYLLGENLKECIRSYNSWYPKPFNNYYENLAYCYNGWHTTTKKGHKQASAYAKTVMKILENLTHKIFS